MTASMSSGVPAGPRPARNDWQARAKRQFIVPLVVVNLAVVLVGALRLASGDGWNWAGPIVAGSGIFLLFGLIYLYRRRSLHAGPAMALALAGTVIGFAGAITPGLVAAGALAITALYVFWYSRLARSPSPHLEIGRTLPSLSFRDLDGHEVNTSGWRGTPTILLFYRGNWCPLCNVQVQELAAGYREIEARGAQVVLVSPQPADLSRKLAAKFDAPMHFLVDAGNVAARTLGIEHPGGTPVIMRSYDAETVFPTAIVLDAEGVVRFAHQTDNYRVRPDPALFLGVLDGT